MKTLSWLKPTTLPAVVTLALLTSCGSGSSLTAVSTQGSGSGAVGDGLVAAGTVLVPAECEAEVTGAEFVALPTGDRVAVLADAFNMVAAPDCGTEASQLIYLDDFPAVTFDDFVIVLATSQLPPSQRSAANIAVQASSIYPTRPEGPFFPTDIDPVPNSFNTDYAAGSPPPAPDLIDAAVIYATLFLPVNLRTRANIAASVNQLLPGTNLAAADILVIPGVEIPGGIPVNPPVGPIQAGNIQISVLDPDLTTPNFTIGPATFVLFGVQPFPGFTTYVAAPGSTQLVINFETLEIEGTDRDTCIVVHQPGQDPFISQIAASEACPTIFRDQGENAPDIDGTLQAFRTALGGPNNGGAPASFPNGFRAINWDATPDAFSDPNAIPGDFFNFSAAPRARGLVFTEQDFTVASLAPLFRVSATAASGVAQRFSSMPPFQTDFLNQFDVFSAERLFAYIAEGGTTFDVIFFLPSDQTTVATVKGFGAVFTDVDLDDSTRLQFLDASGDVLFEQFAIGAGADTANTLSFVGAAYPEGAPIARVRITSGSISVTSGLEDGEAQASDDVVVMDDFIYGEPQPLN